MEGGSKSSSAGASLPTLTPIVKAAAPPAFGGGSSRLELLGYSVIDPSDFDTRFFQSGPTDIYNILSTVDSRIAGLNQQTAGSKATCLSQTPVSYTLTQFGTGQPVTMYGQCYQMIDGNGFVQLITLLC